MDSYFKQTTKRNISCSVQGRYGRGARDQIENVKNVFDRVKI